MTKDETHHLCPVCRRPVTQTRLHHIAGHFDKAHHPCPGSYQTFDITLTDDNGRQPTT